MAMGVARLNLGPFAVPPVLFLIDALRWQSVVLYLGMGRVAVVTAPALLSAVLAGGFIYNADGPKLLNTVRGSSGATRRDPSSS